MADNDGKSLKFRAPLAMGAKGITPSFQNREAKRSCWPLDLRS